MHIKTLTFSVCLLFALGASSSGVFAAKEGADMKATAGEKAFIMKAANGGMTEVELGKIASEKGGSKEVKDFGSKMVTDHSKINDNLKEVAGKMNVTVPDKVNAMHKAKIAKMEKMSGPAFDKAYVNDMVKDHEMDIADFQKADKMVKNADLKKFIEDSIPTMQEHLDMIKKFSQAKG
jgi:putative membrane protein